MEIQNNNTRRNIIIEDTTLTLKCEELGLNSRLVQARIREQGMSFKEAITISENFREYKIAYNDKVWNLKALCEELGLNYSTVHKRLRKYGKTLQEATECKACEFILKDKR